MASPQPAAPKHLTASTRRWWENVVREWELAEHHIRLLTLAAEAWDRAEAARCAVQEHGLIFITRFGEPRARPEVGVERDSRLAFARLLRELDLDLDAPAESRPPSLRSNRNGRS